MPKNDNQNMSVNQVHFVWECGKVQRILTLHPFDEGLLKLFYMAASWGWVQPKPPLNAINVWGHIIQSRIYIELRLGMITKVNQCLTWTQPNLTQFTLPDLNYIIQTNKYIITKYNHMYCIFFLLLDWMKTIKKDKILILSILTINTDSE